MHRSHTARIPEAVFGSYESHDRHKIVCLDSQTLDEFHKVEEEIIWVFFHSLLRASGTNPSVL